MIGQNAYANKNTAWPKVAEDLKSASSCRKMYERVILK